MTEQQDAYLREFEEETNKVLKRVSRVRKFISQPEAQDDISYLVRAQNILFKLDDRFNSLTKKSSLNQFHENPEYKHYIRLFNDTLDAFFNEIYGKMEEILGGQK